MKSHTPSVVAKPTINETVVEIIKTQLLGYPSRAPKNGTIIAPIISIKFAIIKLLPMAVHKGPNEDKSSNAIDTTNIGIKN